MATDFCPWCSACGDPECPTCSCACLRCLCDIEGTDHLIPAECVGLDEGQAEWIRKIIASEKDRFGAHRDPFGYLHYLDTGARYEIPSQGGE